MIKCISLIYLLMFFIYYAGGEIIVNGSNFVTASYGDLLYTHGEKLGGGTGKYIVDYLDFNISANKFFFDGTFLVNSTSLKYTPKNISQLANEFFYRRTIGFKNDFLEIKAGNFKTVFGRGLTLNLQESRVTEKDYTMDGILFNIQNNVADVSALFGRALPEKYKYMKIKDPLTWDSVTVKLEDENNKDNIMCIFLSSYYPFSKLSSFSSGSFGGGIVLFRDKVAESKNDFITDTNGTITDVIEYSNRDLIYLPSWFISISFPILEVNYENSLIYYLKKEYNDSLNKSIEKDNKHSYSSYIGMSTTIKNFYMSAEYKNYFYKKDNNPGFLVVENYTLGPDVRYKHIWHLLNKHSNRSTMEDDIGYGLNISWAKDNITILGYGGIGGKHIQIKDSSAYSLVKWDTNNEWWETYLEWEQKFNDMFLLKTGISGGIIDPPFKWEGTIGIKGMIGPVAEKHSFEFSAEGQYITKKIIGVSDTIKQNDYAFYGYLSYIFNSFIKLFADGEYEPVFFAGFDEAQKGIKYPAKKYFSAGFEIYYKNNTLKFVAGSTAGHLQCNPPPCVYIRGFKGIKFILESNF